MIIYSSGSCLSWSGLVGAQPRRILSRAEERFRDSFFSWRCHHRDLHSRDLAPSSQWLSILFKRFNFSSEFYPVQRFQQISLASSFSVMSVRQLNVILAMPTCILAAPLIHNKGCFLWPSAQASSTRHFCNRATKNVYLREKNVRFPSFSLSLWTSTFAPSTMFHICKLPPDQLSDLKLAKTVTERYT